MKVQDVAEDFLLPMGNINHRRHLTKGQQAIFLLPMGNINEKASPEPRPEGRLSTPYGKHKRIPAYRRPADAPTFYSLWET